VFKLDTAGMETVLYSFTGGTDGKWPVGVILGPAGTIYGCTQLGGSSFGGVVYRLDSTGKEKVLYNFTGLYSGPDGAAPLGVLVRDGAGNLYGTTSAGGGSKSCNGSGCGTVFRLDPTGKETILYSFTGGADGANPDAGLVLDQRGNLYGTTPKGGDLSCKTVLGGCGVVFKLDKFGKEIVLHTFTGGRDGAYPFFSGLIRGPGGNLFGTASEGGNLKCNPPSGCGTAFEVDPAGRLTVLHSFGGAGAASPYAGLTMDRNGNLYGTTYSGGPSGAGSVFKILP